MVVKSILKIIPVVFALILLSFASKQCQHNACESNKFYCD